MYEFKNNIREIEIENDPTDEDQAIIKWSPILKKSDTFYSFT